MSDFKFQQYVAPVQNVETDASGGDGGDSLATAYGKNTATGGAGGEATGGAGGTANGGAGDGAGMGGSNDPSATATGAHLEGDVTGDGAVDLGDTIAKAMSGDGGWGVGKGVGGDGGSADGGDADAGGGDATASNSASSQGGDGGAGGTNTVTATQDTPVTNTFSFTDSFNEDNDVYMIKDSFHSDDDDIDNKGGTIDHSVVGDDFEDSFKDFTDSWHMDIADPLEGAV